MSKVQGHTMKASAFRNSNYPLIPLGNVVTERIEYVDAISFPPLSVGIDGITKQLEGVAKAASTAGRKLVRSGDLAINSRSDRRGASGLASTTGSVSIVNSVFTPNPQKLFPRFAHYLLRSKAFQEEYFRFGTGIVDDLWSTRFSRMRQIRIPLPGLPTQRRIADYLDRETAQIDAMAGALDGLVARLEERRQAIIAHYVSGRTGKNIEGDDATHARITSKGFSYAHLGALGSIVLGKMLAPSQKSESDTNRPYLRAAHIQPRGRLDFSVPEKTMWFSEEEAQVLDLQKDDVVIVEGGAGYGRSALIEEELIGWGFQNSIVRVRPDNTKGHSPFIRYALQFSLESKMIELECFSATLPHFTREKVSRFRIPLPPLDEQRRIADHLDAETAKIDAMIAKAGELRALLDERRSALITATVTGQHPVPQEP